MVTIVFVDSGEMLVDGRWKWTDLNVMMIDLDGNGWYERSLRLGDGLEPLLYMVWMWLRVYAYLTKQRYC